ncbi:MAG: hypothetical protein JWM56_1123 [Candidatus Peribacteria bacterium]|nr:hypothetical protein [Candidatus Peribacteria bacterium]
MQKSHFELFIIALKLKIMNLMAILNIFVLNGGVEGTRTPNPLLAKQVLYQLSYNPKYI